MEAEYSQSQETPSYWPSVLIGALIIGLVLFVFGIASQYLTIQSEPTGSSFNSAQTLGIFACLVAAIGGFISTRHYAKEYDLTFPIGKGALIGLFAGVLGVIISTVLTLLWTEVIDTELPQAFYNWQIANVEAQNIPEQQKEMAIQFIPKPGSTTALMWTAGIGFVMVGILNVISGIIGAKVFAKEED